VTFKKIRGYQKQSFLGEFESLNNNHAYKETIYIDGENKDSKNYENETNSDQKETISKEQSQSYISQSHSI
jgi:hypothetical protein